MILQIIDVQGTTEYKLENFGKGTITFGRNSDQDIVLKDINVSRNHGFIYKAIDGWHISDNASTNGVVINSEIITDHLLRTGDKVVLSVKNQDKAVQMKVIDDEYNAGTDRVADARSTSRYFRMTTGTTGILTKNDAPQSPIISQVPNQMPNPGMPGMGVPNASQFYGDSFDDEVTMIVTDEPVTVSSASMTNMQNSAVQQIPNQKDVTQNQNGIAQPQMPQSQMGMQQPQIPQSQMGMQQPQMPQSQVGIQQPQMPQGQMGMQQPQMPQSQVGIQQPQMPQSQVGIQQPQMPQGQVGMQQPQMPQNQPGVGMTQVPQNAQFMGTGMPVNTASQLDDKPKKKTLAVVVFVIAVIIIIAEAIAIFKLVSDNKSSSDSDSKKDKAEIVIEYVADETETLMS